ncbi:hypothetical protein CVT24_012005 [Panaeolus cyanescens]|uniref:RNase III domain-containing protein n=1 Tax=Panaeolus cyanescens TaxID=181874 RepID=A0A409VHP5_9AGAR|nr:hypothetical protein CVT24_012005 [Panaeolus cyanescens]
MNTLYSSTTTGPPPAAQASHLKRTRSVEGGDGHDVAPPSLPKISIELTLQVFTHKSLRRPHKNPADAEQNDNERLSILGETVFNSVVTDILFRRRPHFVVEDIQKLRSSILHSGIIDNWIALYQLQDKLRSAPHVMMHSEKENERHSVFYAYVGAVFMTSGAGAVKDWIGHLLSQERDYQDLSIGTTDARVDTVTTPPPPKRVKSEASSPMIPHASVAPMASQNALPMHHQVAHQLQMQVLGRQQQQQPTPQQSYPPMYNSFTHASQQSFFQHHVRQPPPHVGMQPVSGGSHHVGVSPPPPANKPNPLSPAQPNLAFLPLFNQRAVQRRVQVDYVPSFSGPPHAGQWTVQCVVNGIIKGVGYGSSKQLAKEEAAKQAYYSMGWT